MFAAVLALAFGMVTPAAQAVPAAQAPRELPDEAAAATAARKFAKPVRVSSKTDELSEVTANPDGTFTFTTAARPQRVRRGNDWVAVDTKLRKNSDGSITPVAATVDTRIGTGVDKPFVVAGREGTEVGLSWPAPLPEPRLDGDTATYPEVLPGVDLQVKATDIGFAHALVVKTAQAAQQPALRKITCGSNGDGNFMSAHYARDVPSGSEAEVALPPGAITEDGLYFAGGIDELRAYDRTLNESEVKALANRSVARAYYPLSENDDVRVFAGALTDEEISRYAVRNP